MLKMQTAADSRKYHLVTKLRRLEVYQSSDGRRLNELSLYELEWLHIEVLNEY